MNNCKVILPKRNLGNSTRKDKWRGVESVKLKIENDKFYVLEAGGEKWIYSHEDEAISSLKEMLSIDKELDEKNVSILEVETRGEKWQVKQLSWSKIALKLLRGEKQ